MNISCSLGKSAMQGPAPNCLHRARAGLSPSFWAVSGSWNWVPGIVRVTVEVADTPTTLWSQTPRALKEPVGVSPRVPIQGLALGTREPALEGTVRSKLLAAPREIWGHREYGGFTFGQGRGRGDSTGFGAGQGKGQG